MKPRSFLTCSGVLLTLLAIPNHVHADETALTVSVQTSDSIYYSGEEVQADVEICNRTSELVGVPCGMACLESAYDVTVVDEHGDVVSTWFAGIMCLAVPIVVEFYPEQCRALSFPGDVGSWWPSTSSLPPGEYRVCFTWIHSELTLCSRVFRISQAQRPVPVPAASPIGDAMMIGLLLLAGTAALRWRS